MTHNHIGPETAKALANFPISGDTFEPILARAYAMVKLAACRMNTKLGYLPNPVSIAIEHACLGIIEGNHDELFITDPFQGGAGTSLNMNLNESIAYLASMEINPAFKPQESIWPVSPIDHVNLHQSTNDTFPSAVKVAILLLLKDLEAAIAMLQEAFQDKEREFASIIKPGRTELQDAVPITLGMEFGAWAEAIGRDRWRIFKSRERIKTLNLGGTAVGTGLGAPRDYILGLTEELKKICGLAISRSENLVDQTQNLDSIVEVSSMNKALAVNLAKIAGDLKLLSSGPDCGFGEITLPDLQKGSSIMPGKINPVMPEAVSQVALKVINDDNLIALASASGQLELNAYLPLIAHTILKDLSMLSNTCRLFAQKCITGIQANIIACQTGVTHSKSLATYLVPVLGYSKVEEIVYTARARGMDIKSTILAEGILNAKQLDDLLSPKRMYRLGFNPQDLIPED